MKKAFTLAEVLITIGIIGVIAAITLPALNANISNSTFEKQILKFYTQTEKALDLYGVDNDTDTILASDFDGDDFAKKYYNIARVCNESKDCFANEYANINANKTIKVNDIKLGAKAYCLQDGSVFSISVDGNVGDDVAQFPITVDTNGVKGPNIIGRDLWTIYVHRDGSLNDEVFTPKFKLESTDEEVNATLADNMSACLNGSADKCFANFVKNGFKITEKKKK